MTLIAVVMKSNISKTLLFLQSNLQPNFLKTQTLMTQTTLGSGKFVLDMGSLSHLRLIIAPGQEANWDNLGTSFQSSMKECYVECSH